VAEGVLPGLLGALHTWPPEALWPVTLLVCFGSTVAAVRWFGVVGISTYLVVAVLAANVQVTKVVATTLLGGPVAEGTIVFASTYLATDILTELYGRAAARRAVWMSFAAYALFTVLMLLLLGSRPLTAEEAGEGFAFAVGQHEHLAAVFTPAPAFFVAGMTSYLLSQLVDIRIFVGVGRLTSGRALWLRNTVSTCLSSLLDSAVFSLLAFRVLAADPVPWDALLWTYILGTWFLRVILSVLDTPFLYLARGALARPPAWMAQPA